jgi:predicted DNA-binding antitoxin AbrB/MazE fold protein
MNQNIPAVFTDGVFRPLAPVDVVEGTQVEEQVPHMAGTETLELSTELLARQRAAIEEIVEIERLPIEGPHYGFLGRDHDKILYGRP